MAINAGYQDQPRAKTYKLSIYTVQSSTVYRYAHLRGIIEGSMGTSIEIKMNNNRRVSMKYVYYTIPVISIKHMPNS